MLEIAVFGIAAVLISSPWRGWGLKAEHILIALMALQAIGYGRLHSTFVGQPLTLIIAWFALLLAAGFALIDAIIHLSEMRSGAVIPNNRLARYEVHSSRHAVGIGGTHLGLALSLFLTLAGIHYFQVGIPVLSESVELHRWRLGISGLFGLPSRAVVIGFPLLIMVWSALRRRDSEMAWPRSSAHSAWLLVSSFAVIAMTGFRGIVLTTILLAVMASLLSRQVSRIRLKGVAAALVATVMALVFAVAMGSLYESYRGTANPAGLLWDRATIDAVEGGHFLISGDPEFLRQEFGTAIGNDFRYYLNRYVPVFGSEEPLFETSAYISTLMTGRTLGGDLFVVPVTVTGVASLLFDLGIFGTLVAAFGLGCCVRWLGRYVQTCSQDRMPVPLTIYAAVVFFFIRGNAAYHLINWVAIGFLCSILLWIGRRLAGAIHRVSRDGRSARSQFKASRHGALPVHVGESSSCIE